MSLSTHLLNPQGRLGPKTFQKCGLVLIGVGLLVSLVSAVSLVLGMLLGVVSLVLIYPWVVIWIKRLRDAGQNPLLVLAVIAVWLVVSMIVGSIVAMFSAGAVIASTGAAASENPFAMMSAMRAASIPGAIVSALVSFAFVYAGANFLKSDPAANAYGPPSLEG